MTKTKSLRSVRAPRSASRRSARRSVRRSASRRSASRRSASRRSVRRSVRRSASRRSASRRKSRNRLLQKNPWLKIFGREKKHVILSSNIMDQLSKNYTYTSIEDLKNNPEFIESNRNQNFNYIQKY